MSKSSFAYTFFIRGHAKSMSLGGGGRGVGQKDDKV